nr:hypothetical protein [uncultured Cohaesibacter sp.]
MVAEIYRDILLRQAEALTALENDNERLRNFISLHNSLEDLHTLKEMVGNRPEAEIFEKAHVEYQRSLAFLSTGHYRQANSSLRLFVELSLSAVLFSANELHLRLWLRGEKDINWNSITCLENGVFSKSFIRIFFEDLSEDGRQYQAIAVKLYRECSEIVHGNSNTYGSDHAISFQPDLFDECYDRTDAALRVVKFAYLLRYTHFISEETQHKVESIALEDFPMLQAIQTYFGRPDNE